MIKKRLIISSTIIAAACIFSACVVSKENVETDRQITGQSPAATPETESHTQAGNTDEQNPAATSEADSHTNTRVENLTEKAAQEICIDYAIQSYEDLQNFGYRLFAQNISDTNPVLSPVSAYVALSMAGCGADGTTEDEFVSVLGDMDVFSDDIMNHIPQNGDILNLSLANSVWIDDEFIVDTEWLGTVRSLMRAEAFQADLFTVDTMNSMNSWISGQTNGMIDKMIDAPLDARLVLFNTVYFKGKWETPFEAENTHTEDFYVDRQHDSVTQAEMMNLYMTWLDCISADFAEGVIMPYRNNPEEGNGAEAKLAFIALKPTGGGDVRDLYSRLTTENIKTMLRSRQNDLVHLKLPKFEVTFDKELNKSLYDMGLTECFDSMKADFSKMGKTKGDSNLYISLVRQKAKIIVDEEGTEAAAVTEIDMRDGAGMISDPKELYFNEPFLYMIMDMERELPLFIGILDNPKGE